MWEIDISPIVQSIIGLSAISLTTLGSWALARLAKKLGIQANHEAIISFDDALAKSVQSGASALQNVIREKGWDAIETQNAIVAWAAPYAIAKFAPALRGIGLDLNNPLATSAYLRDELNRIFPTAMIPIAASPVTPPAPPQPSAPGVTADDLNRAEIDRIARGG